MVPMFMKKAAYSRWCRLAYYIYFSFFPLSLLYHYYYFFLGGGGGGGDDAYHDNAYLFCKFSVAIEEEGLLLSTGGKPPCKC